MSLSASAQMSVSTSAQPKLKYVVVNSCTDVGRGIRHLHRCRHLTSVQLSTSHASAQMSFYNSCADNKKATSVQHSYKLIPASVPAC
ncbi:hypothetical protein HaLaN_32113 [Haematococcus lacustris]|uniref:Uncharacterized protein n=1 Tax=Haematococcus lacustris TaxID=44745 RepID=A0A6A0AJ77_HAELA|nr:hypothetical protein HaLaN_32113 [Haematococcus lacustris]